jgi:hypothetical protein
MVEGARFGPVVLFGSGETSPRGGQIWEAIARRLSAPLRVAILETPAGFELNSAQVAGRIADFLQVRLQNYRPQITVIPARKRGTPFSPDDPAITAPILDADVIFLGPGSPTYAVRQLRDSLAWQRVTACHRLGSALALASAAVIAISALALPVYEIYKVGEDPHWRPGLDFFAPYGLSLVFVSHWNNAEGGAELDTSRCFIGQERFAALLALLPPQTTVVGIDEQTALVMDIEAGRGQVLGLGGVTLIGSGREQHFGSGTEFPLSELGPFRTPDPATGLPPAVWAEAQAARRRVDVPPQPPAEVLALVEARQAARAAQDWATADRLRERIAGLGWQVIDTPQGPRLKPL